MNSTELRKVSLVATGTEAAKLALTAGYCMVLGRINPDSILAGYLLSTTIEASIFATIAIALKNNRIRLLQSDVSILATRLRQATGRKILAEDSAAAAIIRAEIAESKFDTTKRWVQGEPISPPRELISD